MEEAEPKGPEHNTDCIASSSSCSLEPDTCSPCGPFRDNTCTRWKASMDTPPHHPDQDGRVANETCIPSHSSPP